MKKIKVAVIGGGNSGEREISLKSLENVCQEIDKEKFEVYKLILTGSKMECAINNLYHKVDLNDFSLSMDGQKIVFDIVYNTIHGTPGENGILQGYLELLKIPYTSSDVLTSAITFNKEVCKKILKDMIEVKMAKSIVVDNNKITSSLKIIAENIGFPCFVKPNNGGSSVATSKVSSELELSTAIEKALEQDTQAIIEEYIEGTEITCGVACIDGKPKALAITEIVSEGEFFDFEAKYINTKTQEITPARISKELYEKCLQISEQIYAALNCKGIIRIDYFVKNNELYFLEVNTTPGMTDRSLIPQQIRHNNMEIKNVITKTILSYL